MKIPYVQMFLIASMLLNLTLHSKTAIAATPPQYIYSAADPTLPSAAWVDNRRSPYNAYNAAYYPSQAGSFKTKYMIVDGSSSPIYSMVVDVINQWESHLPSWVDFEYSTQSSYLGLHFKDLTATGGVSGTCITAGAIGCYRQTMWAQNNHVKGGGWINANIYTFFHEGLWNATFPPDTKKAVIAHEIGHALGLHERYQDNPGGLKCYSGEDPTVMDATYLDESDSANHVVRHCDHINQPTSLDADRVHLFYEAPYYYRPDTGDSCDSAPIHEDIEILSSGYLRAHMIDCGWHDVGVQYDLQKANPYNQYYTVSTVIVRADTGVHNKVETRYIASTFGSSNGNGSGYYRVCGTAILRAPYDTSNRVYSSVGPRCTGAIYWSPPSGGGGTY